MTVYFTFDELKTKNILLHSHQKCISFCPIFIWSKPQILSVYSIYIHPHIQVVVYSTNICPNWHWQTFLSVICLSFVMYPSGDLGTCDDPLIRNYPL